MESGARHPMPFGAELGADDRTRFRLWAPDASRVSVCIERRESRRSVPMHRLDDGWFELAQPAPAGTRYRYLIDDSILVPDPASRAQPDGPHGPSEVVDPSRYTWRSDWSGRAWREAVLYELHIGTFTSGGTFESAAERLAAIADLGVTAVQIMPVSSFPGRRNWGYDGVLPFAPASVYGGPEGLRRFVDAAHALGLIVLLDVVYNHFGPDGNYLHAYASTFFTSRHETPWGDGINFDGPDSGPVRDYFIHNALYWLKEFRLDGLRLDAVHAIADDSDTHIVDAIALAARQHFEGLRPIHLVLENEHNEAHYLRADGAGRPRYRAQWNDDFHHAAHTLVTGERDGYYADFADRPLSHLARCLSEGFAYQGDASRYRGGEPRGEPSRDLRSTSFIDFLQNHDQIGNRAFGERLTMLAPADALRALTSLLLLAPGVPGLFMGEEFGCRQPFLYFADFDGELAEAVRSGRQREFGRFDRFAQAPDKALPDPMSETSFRQCVIDWEAGAKPEHAAWCSLYRRLLQQRRELLVPRLPAMPAASPGVFAETGLALRWRLADATSLCLLANLGPETLTSELPGMTGGQLLHAEPESASTAGSSLPPWSVIWRLQEPR